MTRYAIRHLRRTRACPPPIRRLRVPRQKPDTTKLAPAAVWRPSRWGRGPAHAAAHAAARSSSPKNTPKDLRRFSSNSMTWAGGISRDPRHKAKDRRLDSYFRRHGKPRFPQEPSNGGHTLMGGAPSSNETRAQTGQRDLRCPSTPYITDTPRTLKTHRKPSALDVTKSRVGRALRTDCRTGESRRLQRHVAILNDPPAGGTKGVYGQVAKKLRGQYTARRKLADRKIHDALCPTRSDAKAQGVLRTPGFKEHKSARERPTAGIPWTLRR
jgi:hypothetical protein